MAFDLSATAAEFLFRVGAQSWTDLDWCTEAEIYGYFDEAAKRLAELGLFVESEATPIFANQAAYALPAPWLDSIHVSVNNAQCRPASAAELLALDATWPALVCEPGQTPTRYSMDAAQLGTIVLYGMPSGGGAIASIDHVALAAITPSNTLAPIPAACSDYFLYFAIQRARGKESDYAMPEVAAGAGEMVALFEAVFTAYWGNVEP